MSFFFFFADANSSPGNLNDFFFAFIFSILKEACSQLTLTLGKRHRTPTESSPFHLRAQFNVEYANACKYHVISAHVFLSYL